MEYVSLPINQINNVQTRNIKNEMGIFPKHLDNNTKQIGSEHNYYDVTDAGANEVEKVVTKMAVQRCVLHDAQAPPEMYDSAVLYSSPAVAQSAFVPIDPSPFILLDNSTAPYQSYEPVAQNGVMKTEWNNLMSGGSCDINTISDQRTNPLSANHMDPFFTSCSDDIKACRSFYEHKPGSGSKQYQHQSSCNPLTRNTDFKHQS